MTALTRTVKYFSFASYSRIWPNSDRTSLRRTLRVLPSVFKSEVFCETKRVGIHADRTSRRYCDHRCLDRAPAARSAGRPRGRPSLPVPEQSQTDRTGRAQLSLPEQCSADADDVPHLQCP